MSGLSNPTKKHKGGKLLRRIFVAPTTYEPHGLGVVTSPARAIDFTHERTVVGEYRLVRTFHVHAEVVVRSTKEGSHA
jgi:hypothetical protein